MKATAVLTLSLWGWIGIVMASWCVVSFAFALWLGRAIRMSDLRAPAEPSRHARAQSGFIPSSRPGRRNIYTGTDHR